MTLRTRIAAVAGLSVTLAVLAVAVSLYIAVRADLRGAVDKGLHARVGVLLRALPHLDRRAIARGSGAVVVFGGASSHGASGGSHSSTGGGTSIYAFSGFPTKVGPAPFGGASGYVQFIAPNGSVLVPGGQGSASSAIAIGSTERAVARRGHGYTLRDRTVNGTRLRVLTQGVGARGAVMVARPLSEVESELRELLLILAIVGAVGIALAAALGAVVAKVALAPIRRFTARTERLSAGRASGITELDLAGRLHVTGRDELGRLADSFNRTLDALEGSVESQRQLVADAGHELRTPIASLRANIQVLDEAELLPDADRQSLREDIVDELDELTALVSDVIELARGSASEDLRDDVRLDEVVAAAVERARRRARGVTFEQMLEPTLVRGDAARIDRAVSNLLENARKWSPEEAIVEVGLHAGVLSVRDHGPGFDEKDLNHVFDRFYRADRARKLPGSGLGLAIVRQAAEAHGGYAEAANAPGGGALLRVSFGALIDLPAVSPQPLELQPHEQAAAARRADGSDPIEAGEHGGAHERTGGPA
ncbi:MAG TPA: HAMP domain-containing sensor histidine kinase [Solirubrobacteraceae bacterium]|nr:HAMP domain-containing sensor histidine kinase [Solirubrobacteraceae bacterium]